MNIKKLKNLISDKLKNRQGISLAELLVTMIFCLMTFSLVITAMQAASRSLTKSTMQSESEILCSTLTMSVEEVLRYAGYGSITNTEDTADNENGIIVKAGDEGDPQRIHFFSRVRGTGKDAYLDNTNNGRIVLRYRIKIGNDYKISYADMAPDSAYTQGMKAKLRLYWNQDNSTEDGKKKYGTFTGTVMVTDSNGKVLNSQNFAVAPLNINR